MFDRKAHEEILKGLVLSRDSLRRVNARYSTYKQDPQFSGSELQRRMLQAMRELDACIALSERQAREASHSDRKARRKQISEGN